MPYHVVQDSNFAYMKKKKKNLELTSSWFNQNTPTMNKGEKDKYPDHFDAI
jgi:hypothetical protein